MMILRMIVVMATFAGFPASVIVLYLVSISSLNRMATRAGMYRA